MTAKGRIACLPKFIFFAFYLEGYMKRITITSIATLLTLWMVACGSLGTGSGKGEKESAGGPNATQADNRPTPSPQEVKQPVTNTQGAKQPVKYAKHRGAGARRSMPNNEQVVIEQVDDVEYQILEPQVVDQVVIDVMQPTEVVQAQPVEVIEQPVAPTVIVDMNTSVVAPQASAVYVASPELQYCSPVYDP